jgi:putative colanic acid biosynthesis glycosyltransferase WcaI
MARVIFLNRFYWPDEPATAQLLADLAEQLAAQGLEVVVLASHPGTAGVPPVETRRSVSIRRIRGTRWSRRFGLAGKAVDFATFFLGALGRLWRTTRRGDIIVPLTDPPLIGVGAWVVARARGAALIHWVQDIYPELAIELAGLRPLALLRPLRDAAWRSAAGCVTLGTDMEATLVRAGVERATIIPNWAPAGLRFTPPSAAVALRAEWGLTGKFVIAYSGNLGRVHDLDPVVAVAELLRDVPRIAFVFIGGGAQRASLEAEVARRGLDHVQFRPPQPRARLAESLAVGDVHLVTLRPGCERYVFPSKLYGIAAIGRPVVFIGPRDSELAQLVTRCDMGLTGERDALPALAASLRQLAENAALYEQKAAGARRFATAAGGSEAAARAWRKVFTACGLAVSDHAT